MKLNAAKVVKEASLALKELFLRVDATVELSDCAGSSSIFIRKINLIDHLKLTLVTGVST